MKTSKGVACPPTARDLTAEAIIPSDGFSGHPMMDNWAADVSGSSPLITVPEEPPDWSSSSLPHPHQPIHHWLKLEAALECQRPSVDGIGADEMHWFECCAVSWQLNAQNVNCASVCPDALSHRSPRCSDTMYQHVCKAGLFLAVSRIGSCDCYSKGRNTPDTSCGVSSYDACHLTPTVHPAQDVPRTQKASQVDGTNECCLWGFSWCGHWGKWTMESPDAAQRVSMYV